MLAVHIGADFLCESQQCWTQRSRCPLCCSAAWIHAWLSAHYSRASPLATHWSHSARNPSTADTQQPRHSHYENGMDDMGMALLLPALWWCCVMHECACLCNIYIYIYIKLLSSLRSWRGQVSGDSGSDQELLICDFCTVDLYLYMMWPWSICLHVNLLVSS